MIPDYTTADAQAHYADKHGIEKNTLVRGEFGNIPAQATKVTELGVHFSNGESHTHRDLHASVENGHLKITGKRATN